MGIGDFFKKVFGTGHEPDPEIIEARKRLNIDIDDSDKAGDLSAAKEEMERRREEEIANYDVWEELKNYRYQFFLGAWATRHLGLTSKEEEKIKEELDEAERKREEKRRGKE